MMFVRQHTKVVFCTRLELLVHHQLLDLPCHGLYVVDNQFIQIGELMGPVYDELGSDRLTSGVCIGFHNV